MSSLVQQDTDGRLGNQERSLPQIEDETVAAVLGDPNHHKQSNQQDAAPASAADAQEQDDELEIIPSDDHLQRAPVSEIRSDIEHNLGSQEPSLLISAMHGGYRASSTGLGFGTATQGPDMKGSPYPVLLDNNDLTNSVKGYCLVEADAMVLWQAPALGLTMHTTERADLYTAQRAGGHV